MNHFSITARALMLAIVGVGMLGLALDAFQNKDPDFTVISPSEGQVFASSVPVEVSAMNFKAIEPNDINKKGEGHFHIYLDGSEAAYDQVVGYTHVLYNLSSGQHTIRISMRNNDHTPYGIDKNITFFVE